MTRPPVPTLRISVVIPTRNRCHLLRELLEALTRQARLPDEVLVVDNDSQDQTPDVVRQFATQLPITYLHERERGAGAARNRGIREAAGDVLAFTDDDCIPDRQWLHFIELSFLRDPSIGMVAGKVTPDTSGASWAERFAAVNHLVCEDHSP
jgi:glycosyltransferase involved in cell wall biosynthesis